ncbi:MAG: EAL domain-containing protein [Thermodesulfovibrionales bacterium]|jgi:diguanylate cyclase (GGDEF)-like protein/PAS domain S-box-containing protein
MKTPLQILHLEDDPNDVLLIREAIIAHGIDAEIIDAATRADFVAALEKGDYDLILADYTLPSFDGLAALSLVREKFPGLPFIFVTGTMGEEKAVETLKRGATDYVLKHNLSRLVPSIMRAMREAEEHIERKKAQEALRESEERFRTLVESAPEAIFVQSQGCFVYLNPAMLRLLGASMPVELLGKEFMERIAPEYHKAVRERIRVQQETGKPAPLMEQEYLRLDGSRVPVETTAVAVCFQDRDAHLVFVRDITERKRSEELLHENRARLDLALRSAGMGVWHWNIIENKRYFDDQSCYLLGINPAMFTGSAEEFFGALHPGDLETTKSALARTIEQDVLYESEYRAVWPDGSVHYMTARGKLVRDNKGRPLRINGILWDITERKQMEEKLKYLAYYDSLTDLPNRNLFFERIDQVIEEAKDNSSSLAVVRTDINKFKSICDLYGSAVGDRVLKEVAERLSASIREGDIAAHLGNDEFGIACLGLTGSDDIIMLDKIIKDISYPLNIHGDEIILTFSTGISLYPHDGENASELLKSAGLALSIAKKEGRKTCQFYSKEMNVEASEMMLLEKQLTKAIKDEEFILHYQPYWDINTKKMVGMEALVRWQSQDKGLVPPGKFIPVLEDTGMIIEVGEWILRTAMRQVKEWQNNGYPVVPVSVNMSLVQFRQKDLAGMVKKIMKDSGYYPSLLTLEITESAFMQDIEFTKSVLTAMKEIGCSVSIDDFGTGYSSLAYLKRFPVDNLKIDISFIREMVRDPDSASIVMAIINMAHALNLKTIAEGIETEEQWNFLRLLRCDMGQGFYLSKPLPAEDFEKLLI